MCRSLIIVLILHATIALTAENPDAGFERTAAAYLGEGEPSAAQARYQAGVEAYEQGQYDEALTHFRQAAIADPDTPHLAVYMIHAEREKERQEEIRMGTQKQQEYDRWLVEGQAKLGASHFPEAISAFEKALDIKPDDVKATALLAQARDQQVAAALETKRRGPAQKKSKESGKDQDPAAAQEHYKAGLLAYAKHDLKEARQEWILTARLDTHHPKVFQAINRVDEELAIQSASQQTAGK